MSKSNFQPGASSTIRFTLHQSNKGSNFALGRKCTGGMITSDSQKHSLTSKTLTIFLGSVLSKKYTNPSSDIITVLAGLHDADVVFSDLIGTIDNVIRNGRSCLPLHLRYG